MSTFPGDDSRVARDLFALLLMVSGFAGVCGAAYLVDPRLLLAVCGVTVFAVGVLVGSSGSDSGRR